MQVRPDQQAGGALKKAEPQSAFERRLAARERKFFRFPVGNYFGIAGEPILEVEIAAPTKLEEEKSVAAAHERARELAKDNEEARRDPDILTDAKAIEVLFRACFEPAATEAKPGAIRYPAFKAGPQWMRENLTSDELAVLFNLVQSVKRKVSPLVQDLDFETVDALAKRCYAERGNDVPDVALAVLTREFLTQAFMVLSMLYCEAIAERDGDKKDSA